MSMSTNKDNEDPNFTASQREKKNESKYRALFSDILKKHEGILGTSFGSSDGVAENGEDPLAYKSESLLLQTVIEAERKSVLTGAAVGVCAFCTFRYAPSRIIRTFGSKEQAKALAIADKNSRADKYRVVKKSVALLFEMSFGGWAGVRAYKMESRGRDDIHEAISKIPLVEGRSIVSEKMCEEWVNAAYREIPLPFWENLKEDEDDRHKLLDPRSWRAIGRFAQNCLKRESYERKLREERGLINDEVVAIPSPGVPHDSLLKESGSDGRISPFLTPEEADSFLEDNN